MLTGMSSTTITRLPEKGVSDRDELYRLLDDALVAHIGLTDRDGMPVVIPTAFARDGDRLLVHGSTGSGWMRLVASGQPACVAVTELGGLVVARSAFESSMRYRSAVLFGAFTRLAGAEHERALDLLTDHLIPGRVAEVRRPSRKEYAATMALQMPITDWSLKVSAGWPEDEESDIDGDAWAGVVPLRAVYGDPLPAPDLRPGIPVPGSVRALGSPQAQPGTVTALR
jgi:uncharacterized protein